jgi:hypothetical protein
MTHMVHGHVGRKRNPVRGLRDFVRNRLGDQKLWSDKGHDRKCHERHSDGYCSQLKRHKFLQALVGRATTLHPATKKAKDETFTIRTWPVTRLYGAVQAAAEIHCLN